MKIINLKANNFRNLKKINVDFQDINIITGRNSTGKTNIIQLLRNCIKTSTDIEGYFGKNIISTGQGISSSTIEVKLQGKPTTYGYIYKEKEADLYRISEYTLTKEITKNPINLKKLSLKLKGKHKRVKNFDFTEDPNIYFRGLKEKIIKNAFIKDYSNNTIFEEEGSSQHISTYKGLTEGIVVSHDDKSPFSMCSSNIFKYVTGIEETNKKELAIQALERLNEENTESGTSNFTTAKFIFLLADLQKSTEYNNFKKDLQFFTNGIVSDVYINTSGTDGSKGDIYIKSPNGPRDIDFISAGTSIILYFVTIKNWIKLSSINKSYIDPKIMIFDELDSSIHPSLIGLFVELLVSLSKNIQLFISSHGTGFIDCFSKDQLYLLKDIGSFSKKANVNSNILSYSDILNSLNEKEKSILGEMMNSELYINCDLDSAFPTI